MRQGLLILALLTFGVLGAVPAEAAPTRARKPARKPTCNVVGLVPLKQFVTAQQRKCYKSAVGAEKAGLAAFSVTSSAKISRRQKSQACKVVGVPTLEQFFGIKERRCFKNVTAAMNADFGELIAGTTSTGTGGPGTGVGEDEPLPPGPAINYTISMGADEGGSSLGGSCTAVLNEARTSFTATCTHNVPNPGYSHIVNRLTNAEICRLNNLTGNTLAYNCTLTPRQARVLLANNGLIDVHEANNLRHAIAGLIVAP